MSLGQHVCQLGRSQILDKAHFPVIDHCVHKVLSGVNVLSEFTAPEVVEGIAPLNAG